MSGKVKCSCGHSWSKSDSSKKDMNVCHICGKDNTMKDGGWLDKYNDGGPVQPNYNDYSVSAGPGFEGDGYSNEGRNYSPAWGGQFAMGGSLPGATGMMYARYDEGGPVKKFMQPTQTFMNFGYNPKENGLSTEYSTTVGKDGEYYLVPGFKQGRLVEYPEDLFNQTGEHLGGPFKTIQSAEDFAKFRHQYVEKNKNILAPFKTRDYAMGGSIPGAVGFTYARTGSIPSNGKYAKKTMASAQNGTEMKFYQEGLDFQPKSIAKNGKKTPKLTNEQMAKQLGLKKAQTVNPVEQANAYVPEVRPSIYRESKKDLFNELTDKYKTAFEVVANPISALSAMNRHGRLPRNFSKGEYSPFDIATGWQNPFARISSIIDTYQSGKDVISGKGNLADYVDLALTAHSAKGISKNVGKTIKDVKKVIDFNKEQKKLPNREASEWMKNWYSDPVIKQRIVDNTPMEFVPAGITPIIDNKTGAFTLQSMPARYTKAKRNFWNDPVTNPIGNKDYYDLLKEKGFKDWSNLMKTSAGVSYGSPDQIYAKRSLLNKAERESTRVHEATHAMEYNGTGLFKEEDDALLKPFNLTGEQQYNLPKDKGYGKKYYTTPTEIHARMNESRYKLGHTPGQEYTQADFNKSMEMNNMDGMGRYIKDPKAFIELMNTFYQAAPVIGAGAVGAAAIANQPEMRQGGQLTKLDQLTNFTNYNTKQPGGWLDKYQ